MFTAALGRCRSLYCAYYIMIIIYFLQLPKKVSRQHPLKLNIWYVIFILIDFSNLSLDMSIILEELSWFSVKNSNILLQISNIFLEFTYMLVKNSYIWLKSLTFWSNFQTNLFCNLKYFGQKISNIYVDISYILFEMSKTLNDIANIFVEILNTLCEISI